MLYALNHAYHYHKMEKLVKLNYKGIEYIRLSTLSPIQAESIRSTLDRNQVINIQVGQQILRDCVLYKYYEAWHQQHASSFVGEAIPEEAKTMKSESGLPKVPKIAFGS